MHRRTWAVKNGDERGLVLRFCDALLVVSGWHLGVPPRVLKTFLGITSIDWKSVTSDSMQYVVCVLFLIIPTFQQHFPFLRVCQNAWPQIAHKCVLMLILFILILTSVFNGGCLETFKVTDPPPVFVLTYSMQQSPSWEVNRFSANQEISPHFMVPEGSLPHSQVPTIWRSILILSSHLHLGLPSGLFPSGFTFVCPVLYYSVLCDMWGCYRDTDKDTSSGAWHGVDW